MLPKYLLQWGGCPAPLTVAPVFRRFRDAGQSNMALETYYTFSADTLKEEIAAGKYPGLRHFMYGSMGGHFEALAPQFVTTWNSLSTGPQYTWHDAANSTRAPSRAPGKKGQHSPWAQFSATCMYFGAELMDARRKQGLEPTPIGLIQSAIGGSQIESWMDNQTLALCKNESLSGGAIPQNQGRLYYGMIAPFVNYSVAGWLWYQVFLRTVVSMVFFFVGGVALAFCVALWPLLLPPSPTAWGLPVDLCEAIGRRRSATTLAPGPPFHAPHPALGLRQGENNCHGDMGNVIHGTGYGCSLPAMIDSWRAVWCGDEAEKRDRLFGIATLAAGGSEGSGMHMAGMRWSQTANYGHWPNPAMPNTFGAQVYDLGDPWSEAGDGNRRLENQTTGLPVQPERLSCCLPSIPLFNVSGEPGCPNKTAVDPRFRQACSDKFECALPDPTTREYGEFCAPFDPQDWSPAMRSVAPMIKSNSPSGVPGSNFMGGM